MDTDNQIENLLSSKGRRAAPDSLRGSIEAGIVRHRKRRIVFSFAASFTAVAAALLIFFAIPRSQNQKMTDERINAVGEYINAIFIEVTDTSSAGSASPLLINTADLDNQNIFDYEERTDLFLSL